MNNEEKWSFLCDVVKNRYPVLAPIWVGAPLRFGSCWLDESIPDIESVYGVITRPISQELSELIDGYAEFCNDSMRNQVYFERNGRYRSTSYAEVARDTYHNEEHMKLRYLPGMFISHYLWPHHYHMARSFSNTVIPRLRNVVRFFEVGVGCGVYSKLTLLNMPNTTGVGFDISQFSLDYTSWMLNKFNLDYRYSIVKKDIQFGYHEKCDFLICQEVLEHLENPALFCLALAEMVKFGGYAYITAALNAGHSDHIYLYKEPHELEIMLRAAGLQPVYFQEEFAIGYKPRNLTPSLAGFLCERVK